ncbi:MAG TPA: Ppx/GppA phosphatase family protein [Steroidobacteraceae bacterium]|nr:Ppx/GppA phosphatase family protein [Steroidobacteraceae bacterium]HRX89501.1 Ppx/GppA phosphatase family protein [Steroidobacteraceae bacterium]
MARRAAKAIPEVLAAVDLGSNSFHMVVARHSHGQLTVLDKLREMVRLAAGIEPDGRLNKEVAARALACLERFGQRLRDMRANSVRVVGTSALRMARRTDSFVERARAALGHPIEIISGIEEARLIYSGVSHTMAPTPERRLVCDIGGGSTEIIIGEGLAPLALESLTIGCVRLSEQYFADGRLSAKRFARARLAARLAIEPYQAAFRRRGWDQAVGSAGTVRAIGDAVRELQPTATEITIDGLELILASMTAIDHIRDLPLDSVNAERRKSFAGGVAILAEVFEQLGIEQMRVADGAMREGLLYDLLGRYTDEDARERSVRGMQQRYHVDLEQAERVENTALAFLQQVEEIWDLADPDTEQLLRWAARLHEIGLDVAHSGYHRHGAYLLEHADMAGFTREEQMLLAQLVALHRRKPSAERLTELRPPWHERVPFMAVLLRLAVLLHRGRSSTKLPDIVLTPRKRGLELGFPQQWLDDHPLTDADLQNETDLLKLMEFKLTVTSIGAR